MADLRKGSSQAVGGDSGGGSTLQIRSPLYVGRSSKSEQRVLSRFLTYATQRKLTGWSYVTVRGLVGMPDTLIYVHINIKKVTFL